MILAFALWACASAEERFPDRYADAVCARWADCDEAGFDERYPSRRACETDWALIAEAYAVGEGDYVRAAGRDCLHAIQQADCGAFASLSFLDECEDAWSVDSDAR